MNLTFSQEVEYQRRAKIIVASVLSGALRQVKTEENPKLGGENENVELANKKETEKTLENQSLKQKIEIADILNNDKITDTTLNKTATFAQEVEYQRQAKMIVADVLSGALRQIKKEENLANKKETEDVVKPTDISDKAAGGDLNREQKSEMFVTLTHRAVGDTANKSDEREKGFTECVLTEDHVDIIIKENKNHSRNRSRGMRILTYFRRSRDVNMPYDLPNKKSENIEEKKTRRTLKMRITSFFCCGKAVE